MQKDNIQKAIEIADAVLVNARKSYFDPPVLTYDERPIRMSARPDMEAKNQQIDQYLPEIIDTLKEALLVSTEAQPNFEALHNVQTKVFSGAGSNVGSLMVSGPIAHFVGVYKDAYIAKLSELEPEFKEISKDYLTKKPGFCR